jgi:hypothetical protein
MGVPGLEIDDAGLRDGDRPPQSHPRPATEPCAKSDHQEQLNVIARGGGFRSPSPGPAFVSVLESEHLGHGRDASLDGCTGARYEHPSSVPLHRSFTAKAARFWTRNKGLGLVLLAQVFGTLMNVTTRLLEMEGNNGIIYSFSQFILMVL